MFLSITLSCCTRAGRAECNTIAKGSAGMLSSSNLNQPSINWWMSAPGCSLRWEDDHKELGESLRSGYLTFIFSKSTSSITPIDLSSSSAFSHLLSEAYSPSRFLLQLIIVLGGYSSKNKCFWVEKPGHSWQQCCPIYSTETETETERDREGNGRVCQVSAFLSRRLPTTSTTTVNNLQNPRWPFLPLSLSLQSLQFIGNGKKGPMNCPAVVPTDEKL